MHRCPPILRLERAFTPAPPQPPAAVARTDRTRRWPAGLLVSLVVIALVPPAAAHAAGTLDQQQTDTASNPAYIESIDAGAVTINESHAQTFTAGVSGRLEPVDLPLAGGAADPLIVEIRDTTGGAPGAVLVSASVPASSVPDQGFQWVAITFDAPASVRSGTQYAIVAHTVDGWPGGYAWFGSQGDTYAGGGAWSNLTTSPSFTAHWAGGFDDQAFKTFVTAPDTPTTAIALDPAAADGERGWYVSNPRATVVAADQAGGSGVAETRCVLDPAMAPSSFDELPAGCDYTGKRRRHRRRRRARPLRRR